MNQQVFLTSSPISAFCGTQAKEMRSVWMLRVGGFSYFPVAEFEDDNMWRWEAGETLY